MANVRRKDEIEKAMKENPMGKLPRESGNAYRGFLLWAMQTPHKRAVRPVSKALQKSYPTVRDYSIRWLWSERAKAVTSDAEAQAIYRRIYFKTYGMSEIAMVEKNIVAPISVMGNMPRDIADAVDRTVRETNPPKSTVFSTEVKRKHLMLIDAAIGYVAQGIKTGDVRRSLRDIPLLMQLRSELTGENKSGDSSSGVVLESVRVRDAKKNGGDIIEALHEDATELAAILHALASRGKSGIEGVAEEEITEETQ